jgi:hypothetical protein
MVQERRKYKRIKINRFSKINNLDGTVVNISKEGLLVTTDLEGSRDSDEQIQVKLKIMGKWVDLTAIIVWRIQDIKTNSVSMGAYIKDVPPEYKEYLDNLYFEASEKTSNTT